MSREEEARQRLKHGIKRIAAELEFDPVLAETSIEELSKEDLLQRFCDLKDLRLQKENARMIDFLIG